MMGMPTPSSATDRATVGWRALKAMFIEWIRGHWKALQRFSTRLPLAQQLIVSGVMVGVASGLAAYAFENLIAWFGALTPSFGRGVPSGWTVLAVVGLPTLGGLISGVITHHYCPEAKGHGVMEVVAALRERDGHIENRVMWAKSLASAATIGSGGSAGREGPIIQIGAAVGSWVGRLFRVSKRNLRMLAAAGAAGGLAASFSVPLAGVVFTMEVILKDFANEAFSAVVVSSVTSSVTARLLLGNQSFFTPFTYEWGKTREFVFFAFLGALCGPVGTLFQRVLHYFEELFSRQRTIPASLMPAVGGFLVGALSLILPAVRGQGKEEINAALLGHFTGWYSLACAGGKVFATAFTLGSGGSGGSLMPALFIGAMLGGAFGKALLPFNGLAPGAGPLAMVGMAGVFSAAFRAPITAVIMTFEITRDYGILAPVMLACVLSHMLSRSTTVEEGAGNG